MDEALAHDIDDVLVAVILGVRQAVGLWPIRLRLSRRWWEAAGRPNAFYVPSFPDERELVLVEPRA